MRQSFHFQKIPGGLNINIFCENWHEASFYIKEQTHQKNRNLRFINYFLDPQKSTFSVFEEEPPQQICSSCFGFDSALKTINAKMSIRSVFLKRTKKSY